MPLQKVACPNFVRNLALIHNGDGAAVPVQSSLPFKIAMQCQNDVGVRSGGGALMSHGDHTVERD